VALLTALEECIGSAAVWPVEPQKHIVVAIEHDRKQIPTHTSVSLLDDTIAIAKCASPREVKPNDLIVICRGDE
jgi:hypothetical protein